VDPACQRQYSRVRSLSPSLSRCPAGPACRCQFSFARSLSLSLFVSRARFASRRAVAPPASPFLSLRRGPSLSDLPSPRPPWTGACALAHVTGFHGHDAAHAPNSLLIAPPAPCAHPSPHFAHLHRLSRSALAASRRRRPAPVFPTIQLTGDYAQPPRAPPRGETPVPVPNFPYCALCSSNFAFTGARPRLSARARAVAGRFSLV
jgi:hypothetical protein